MLGLPYVFKSAGWIGGFCVTLALCLVTWRTSYYIGRELNGDPRPLHLFENVPFKRSPTNGHDDSTIIRMRKPINGFPGIAREALGDAGSIVLSSVLYFELFSCLSIFFVSLGDHLHLLFPTVSETKHMTIVAGLLIFPSALLRTPKLLSYLSMVGTISTVLVVSAVVLSALITFVKTAENSGMSNIGGDREYIIYSADGLSLALGLVAYCFSGHAVVPSIYQ
jgi:vesicular inhibitory amino acid transporter